MSDAEKPSRRSDEPPGGEESPEVVEQPGDGAGEPTATDAGGPAGAGVGADDGSVAEPPSDRVEPGGVSMGDGEESTSDMPSPSAATPDLADPPPEGSPQETTPMNLPESEWVMPVTSVPHPMASVPDGLMPHPGDEDTDGPEIVRPVTAVPDDSLPVPRPPVTRAPVGSAFGYPAKFANAPGTGFHLALPQLGTIVAGSAVGSMVAGISAVVVAVAAGCLFGLAPLISAAASVLAVFCAGGAFLLAGLGIRQIRRSAGEFRGMGMAITGSSGAGVALLIAVFVFLVLLLT